jgi:hypothetical protein
MNAAVNGMAAEENLIAQHSQAYNAQAAAEMSRCTNCPVRQIQQQLAAQQQQLTAIQQDMVRTRAE